MIIIEETPTYLRQKKKLLKKGSLTKEQIENSINILKTDINNYKIEYKHIICKKDKKRHSFRVINTQYRFLVTDLREERGLIILLMLLDHDKYDRANKNC